MNDLKDHELACSFFHLPAETRLHIYSYLIPNSILEIDLCSVRRPEYLDSPLYPPRRSVVTNLLQQTLNIDTITRTNGLHLLLVSQRTRSELLPLLAKTIVRFHCPKCFQELLRNLSYGFGVGVTWMKHVEIIVDLVEFRQVATGHMLTRQLARVMATEAMFTCKKTAWLFYGRLDLTRQEQWKCRPLMEKRNSGSDTDPTTEDAVLGVLPQIADMPQVPLAQGQGNYQNDVQSHQKWVLIGNFDI